MVNKRKMKERREEKSLANKEAFNRMNFLYQVVFFASAANLRWSITDHKPIIV